MEIQIHTKKIKPTSEELKKIVEGVCGVKLKDPSRKREIVEARIIYSHILHNMGRMTVSRIGRSLNKNHATILHYLKNFHYIEQNDLALIKYNHCLNAFTQHHPVNFMEFDKVKKLTFSLEKQINVLTLTNNRLKKEKENYEKRNEQFGELYSLIENRVRPHQVKQVTKKLNSYLNGL
jgi:hypothetical protein